MSLALPCGPDKVEYLGGATRTKLNMTRPARARLEFDQTTDAPDKVKQATAGTDKVKSGGVLPEQG